MPTSEIFSNPEKPQIRINFEKIWNVFHELIMLKNSNLKLQELKIWLANLCVNFRLQIFSNFSQDGICGICGLIFDFNGIFGMTTIISGVKMGWLWLSLFVAKVSRAPRDQPIPSARFQSIRIGVQFQLVDTLNLILMTSSKSIIFLLGLFFDIFQYSNYSSCSCVYFLLKILICSEHRPKIS